MGVLSEDVRLPGQHFLFVYVESGLDLGFLAVFLGVGLLGIFLEVFRFEFLTGSSCFLLND